MKIKEYRLMENGDFNVLVSFSHEDIEKMGFDTSYPFNQITQFITAIIREFEKFFAYKLKKRRANEKND